MCSTMSLVRQCYNKSREAVLKLKIINVSIFIPGAILTYLSIAISDGRQSSINVNLISNLDRLTGYF